MLLVGAVAGERASGRTAGPNLKVGALMLPAPAALGNPQSDSRQTGTYDVLLRSKSLSEQREALRKIIDDPQKYIPRI
jgi:hypothetical protein